MGRYEAEGGPSKVSSFLAIFYSAEFRKFQTVLIGVAVAAATAGLLPAVATTWVLLIVGVLTSAGVYVVPNSPQKLILQPAGTTPAAPDVVVEVAEDHKMLGVADTSIDYGYGGDVRG